MTNYQMLGYITHRNEDGTWYLEHYGDNGDNAEWTQCFQPWRRHTITAGIAAQWMETFEARGMYQVRYHGALIKVED